MENPARPQPNRMTALPRVKGADVDAELHVLSVDIIGVEMSAAKYSRLPSAAFIVFWILKVTSQVKNYSRLVKPATQLSASRAKKAGRAPWMAQSQAES